MISRMKVVRVKDIQESTKALKIVGTTKMINFTERENITHEDFNQNLGQDPTKETSNK